MKTLTSIKEKYLFREISHRNVILVKVCIKIWKNVAIDWLKRKMENPTWKSHKVNK